MKRARLFHSLCTLFELPPTKDDVYRLLQDAEVPAAVGTALSFKAAVPAFTAVPPQAQEAEAAECCLHIENDETVSRAGAKGLTPEPEPEPEPPGLWAPSAPTERFEPCPDVMPRSSSGGSPNSSVWHVYCLKLRQDKYYVGKSAPGNVGSRIEAHHLGTGSAWTAAHKPLSLVFCKGNCDSFDEDKETIKAMAQYGIENVRGGKYSRMTLSEQEVSEIEQSLRSALDSCFKCGCSGHFAADCPGEYDYEDTISVSSGASTASSSSSSTRTTRARARAAGIVMWPCRKCGGQHYLRDCPVPGLCRLPFDKMAQCTRCNKRGHRMENCMVRLK